MKREGKGFQLLARRWVVERTFAWLIQKRRLVVDYEKLPERARISNLYRNGSSNVQTSSSDWKICHLIFYLQTVSHQKYKIAGIADWAMSYKELSFVAGHVCADLARMALKHSSLQRRRWGRCCEGACALVVIDDTDGFATATWLLPSKSTRHLLSASREHSRSKLQAFLEKSLSHDWKRKSPIALQLSNADWQSNVLNKDKSSIINS